MITGDTSSGEDCDHPVYPFFHSNKDFKRLPFLRRLFYLYFTKQRITLAEQLDFVLHELVF